MQELRFLHSASHLMLIDIYMKSFLKISLTGFKLQSGHSFVSDNVPKKITQKV